MNTTLFIEICALALGGAALAALTGKLKRLAVLVFIVFSCIAAYNTMIEFRRNTIEESKPAANSADSLKTEHLFWQSVLQLNTKKGYEDYLEKYPKGEFKALAEDAWAKLVENDAPAPTADAATPAPVEETSAPVAETALCVWVV
jgi:hypothetical protein